MTTRTVKILGWGTGVAHLTVTLDKEPVFSGDVDLIEFSNDNAGEKTAPTLFTFELPIEFVGDKKMKITVSGASVRFGQIVANYTEVNWGEIYHTGPYEFADISTVCNDSSRDPRSNVQIDGVLQSVNRAGMNGTWHWNVTPGSVFEHDITVPKARLIE